MEYRNLKDLTPLEGNPRKITPEKLVELVNSIKDNPGYFEARPIILSNRTGDLVIIAGNQRYEAAKALKLKKVPTHLLEGLTEEKEREIIIRDNVNQGEFDWEILQADWNMGDLQNWGVELPGIEWDGKEPEIKLAEGSKEPFQQITFTLADKQAELIQKAVSQVKKSEDFNSDFNTFGNKNSNGNAIYLIVKQWIDKLTNDEQS